MECFGKQIKNIREYKNLTQSYVANKIGISQSKLARIESGKKGVTDELLSSISIVFETNVDLIKNFDINLKEKLKSHTDEFTKANMISQVFKELIEIHKEEIKVLERKIKVMESF